MYRRPSEPAVPFVKSSVAMSPRQVGQAIMQPLLQLRPDAPQQRLRAVLLSKRKTFSVYFSTVDSYRVTTTGLCEMMDD